MIEESTDQYPLTLEDVAPVQHRVEVRALDGDESTGRPPRKKYFGLFQNGLRTARLEIHTRDVVEFVMPHGESGIVTFLPARSPNTPLREHGPFGINPIEVRGQRTVGSAVAPSQRGADWEYEFTIYLSERYHVVDGGSTPVVVVHDP